MTSKLLLDSNATLWALEHPARLGARATRMIDDADQVMVSIVSPWELGIKAAKDRLSVNWSLFSPGLREAGFELLAITFQDARLAATLPLLHKDPFDRMIVAQAMNRQATVVTSDAFVERYGVKTLRI